MLDYHQLVCFLTLITYGTSAWKGKLPQLFLCLATELTVSQGGIILCGTRIVTPAILQHKALHLAHRGHQGFVKTTKLLQSRVWFPRIDTLLDKTVKRCIACQAATPDHPRDPLPLSELSKTPWTELSLNSAGPFLDGGYAMVVIDDYSK